MYGQCLVDSIVQSKLLCHQNPLKWVCTCKGSFAIIGDSGPLTQVNLGAVAEAAKLLVLRIHTKLMLAEIMTDVD